MRADAWPSAGSGAEPGTAIPAEPQDPAARDAAARTPAVLVAVLTYRRPDDLAAVLPLLAAEASAATGSHARAVEVLVVDNDPDAGACAQVAGLGIPGVRYVHEPRSGIAAARNRALDEVLAPSAAAQEHDVLVFVDDDERPREGWLSLLLATHAAHGAGGVVGPVISDFAVPLDAWVRAGGFFDRRRMPTGTPVTVAATNNLLLDVARLRAAGVRFDERLGLAGGSDTLFTRQLVAAAGPLVWCDEAIVTDVVPAARATRDWVLRRQLRSGNSWSRTALMLAPSPLARLGLRARFTALGAARVGAGLARGALGLLTRDVRHRAAGSKLAARGLGMVLGSYGYGYVEYRRPAGPS
jgi:hypothetical protein